MQKVKYYRCPICKGIKYTSLKLWENHMISKHPDKIPTGWTPAQYFYYLQTGKDHTECINCGKHTAWNEATLKYNRFCDNPNCKSAYREEFKNKMINTYGKVTLLNDPDQQRKMLMAKKNTGKYKFRDGGEIEYVSSYELDFLKMLDNFLHLPSQDIMGPSPHTYYYKYVNVNDKEHEGMKFYIPDYYIPSLNLEIEIKDDTTTHPKIRMIDKVKEKCKDDTLTKNNKVNYLKIVDKDYTGFFKLLLDLKASYPEQPNVPANESMNIDNSIDFMKLITSKLLKYEYGLNVNGTIINPFENQESLDIFNKLYKTQTPSKFEKMKCGTCYDFSSYMYKAYNEKGLDVSEYFMILNISGTIKTHTFVTIKIDNKYYYTEAAFGKLLGIWVADTNNALISMVLHEMGRFDASSWEIYDISKYHGRLYDLSTEKYINFICNRYNKMKFNYNYEYKVTQLDRLITTLESTNSINNYYRPSIKQMRVLPVTYKNIGKYVINFPGLTHARVSNTSSGEIFLHGNNSVVGYYNTEKKDDGLIWLQAIEIDSVYQHRGIGTQIFKKALKDTRFTNLSVRKTNTHAIHMYQTLGFEIYYSNDYMYFMKKK